jgi:hypothetical protein
MIKNKEIMNYYIGIGLISTHLLFLIVRRPYESNFSNFSLIFNQIAILFSFFWVFSKGTPLDTAANTTYFVYGFIGILCAVNFFAIIRSVIAFKQNYFSNNECSKDKK